MEKVKALNNFDRFQSYMSDDEKMRRVYNGRIADAEESGIKKGEVKREREMAKSLLKLNMPIEQIMEVTNLSKKEIFSLKQ